MIQTRKADEGTAEMQEYQQILQHNKHFQKKMIENDPNYFINLSKGQNPEYLLIGCSDSRVPADVLMHERPGEVFEHRNIANQVLPADGSVNTVIQYAVEHLKVKHIIILGHTGCGGVQAAFDLNCLGGQLDLWLGSLRGVIEKSQTRLDQIPEYKDKLLEIAKLNIIEQVHNTWKNPFVQQKFLQGDGLWIHGWMFHVDTGLIEDLIMENKIPKQIQEAFMLHFEAEKVQQPPPQQKQQPQGCFDRLFSKKKA